jgi:hypothetical protein
MPGGPAETMASAEESAAFADSLNLESLKITIGKWPGNGGLQERAG